MTIVWPPIKVDPPTGWICSRCNASNAPDVTQCPCSGFHSNYGCYGERPKVPRHVLCPCNKANGGSGLCGCVIGNELVEDTR